MIEYGISLLPFWDQYGKRGGYKLAAAYNRDQDIHDVIGPTNRRYWLESSLNHNVIFQQDVLDWLENQSGPGSTPEARRIICWDCTALVSLIIQPMLRRGYTQTESWTPKKKEFFIIDDGLTIYTLVFRSAKTGAEIRIISLKNYVRGTNGLPDIISKIIPGRAPLGDIPVEQWDEPGQGGLRAIFEHAKALTEIWDRCFTSGYIWESSGRSISAGGIAWSNFCRELWAAGRNKPWEILFPGMGPELVRQCRDELEDELRPGSRGAISFARPGDYTGVYGYDLNSAYGAALDDWIPYGELMEVPPDNDPCRGIVYPQGFFMIKSNRLPIISWSNNIECQRYAWERTYKPHEKVYDFFLDGSMPFYQEEWELLLEFYEPVGGYCIPKVWYISIMHWGLLGDRMKRLYWMERQHPEDKIFNKMQIVQLYGKLSQRQETENIYYILDPETQWPKRIAKTVPISSQHLGLGIWVTTWCRCRIMKQLLHMFDNGIRPDDVIYIDTDQIYLSRDCSDLFDLDPETPGKWKIEQYDVSMNIIAPKNYQVLKADGRVKTVSSSLPGELKRSMPWGELQQQKQYPYFSYERDPKTWIKGPVPHMFSPATTFCDPESNSYVIPEEIERINEAYR